MTIPQQVGTRIKRFRLTNDLNQQQMANKLGLTPSAYAKIERGETYPSITRLHEIAAIFETDIVSLITDSPPSADNFASTEPFHSLASQVTELSDELETLKKQVALRSIKKRK